MTITHNRLLPIHPGGDLTTTGSESMQHVYQERRRAMYEAPNLDKLIREHLVKQGKQKLPEGQNLALLAVEEFRSLALDAVALRKAFRHTTDPLEQKTLLSELTHLKSQMAEYLKFGLSFEMAYRNYLAERRNYQRFSECLNEAKRLESMLLDPTIKSLDPEANLTAQQRARIQSALRYSSRESNMGRAKELRALACVYEQDSAEYKSLSKTLCAKASAANSPATQEDLKKHFEETTREAKALWQNPMVRYFWGRKQNEKLLSDIARGKDVLEDPETIERLNKMRKWEYQHHRTTVGGVFVGPPGTGKTTLVRHYLALHKRQYVYIDLSEDVTRYLLLGSKELRFANNSAYYRELAQELTKLDEPGFRSFVKENTSRLSATAKLAEDQALVVLLGQIDTALEVAAANASKLDSKMISKARKQLTAFTENAYHRELASEFAHLVKKNGWRDGVVVAALRRGDCIIFDEFPHFKQWHMLDSLMTAKPGEKWYFGDNDEWVEIPKHWRMYFTGNIGRRHGGFVVPEKMSSRVQEQVMSIGYPSKQTELGVAIALISDPLGNVLRSREDLVKLGILVNDAFPKIRALIEREHHTVPISYRTLWTLAEKLVQRHDPHTNELIYRSCDETSFDQALFEVMVGAYALYEEKKVPKEIVNILTSVGLLLDKSVKSEVLQYLDSNTYEERCKSFADMKPELEKIEKTLRGMADDAWSSADSLPPIFKIAV